ncbi:hypothetical protein [Sphingobium vermicomposti]|uniref:Uncharacterized protein n=1 Tax=Sphingobium vermicomposti TaxID=529005 RepID=A0A846LZ96_9SPHN|nr:hypothetical protein [Sphingobium vermicomposti]NIJ15207.1 hypothetical protein [Sphingobium vermicomposti]
MSAFPSSVRAELVEAQSFHSKKNAALRQAQGERVVVKGLFA